MYKRVTVKQVFEALEKNGHPWGKGAFYREATTLNGGTEAQYCAIGQAAKNLDVVPTSLHLQLNNVGLSWLGTEITHFNDTVAQTYDEVVEHARNTLYPYFDREIEVMKK